MKLYITHTQLQEILRSRTPKKDLATLTSEQVNRGKERIEQVSEVLNEYLER